MADVTFPSIPRVVSLYHYDDIRRSGDSLPVAGYPAVCVTVRLIKPKASKYVSPLSIVSEFVSVVLSYLNIIIFSFRLAILSIQTMRKQGLFA